MDSEEGEKLALVREHERLSIQKALDFCSAYRIPFVPTYTL